LPTPKIKIKPKTWNSFLKNTKGTYNKYNFDGNYQKALQQRTVDYQNWKKRQTVIIGK
jgi:hypothetical protein